MVQSQEIRAENVRAPSLSSKDAEQLLFMLNMARDMHTATNDPAAASRRYSSAVLFGHNGGFTAFRSRTVCNGVY